MAQSNDPPVSVPVSVIGTQFIAPYPLEVKIEKISTGNLVITDTNNKIMLKVKPCDTSFHRQRLLLDSNDRPIVMLREKNMSEHKRWNVYRGESKAELDMIFSTKTKHMIQFKTRVEVYLQNKKSSKDDYDFKVEGNWSKKSCAIYMGDSSTAIAQMNTVQPSDNVKLPKNNFLLTINANVDYAFVVALITIVDAMKSSDVARDVGVGVGIGLVIGSC